MSRISWHKCATATALVALLLIGVKAIATAERKPQMIGKSKTYYDIGNEKYNYSYTWSARTKPADPDPQGSKRNQDKPLVFNWIARRDPCFLVSGDTPRFGLARCFPVLGDASLAPLSPPISKLGDLRIRCTVGGNSYWLDEAKEFTTRFYPWGTIHNVSLKPDAPLSFTVKAFMLGTQGIAVQIDVTADSGKREDVAIELVYGGVHQKGRPSDVPSYFNPIDDPAEWQDDMVTLEQNKATLTDSNIPVKVVVMADPFITATKADNHVVFKYDLSADQETKTLRVLAFQVDEGSAPDYRFDQFDKYVHESQDYYKAMLDQFDIHTPDKILNAGFYSALVNLDYVYQAPAWLEGIHWWNAWWCNNYQISAAICLGQMDRARDAVRFFAGINGGPAAIVGSDGMPHSGPDDGLPYYIQQLYRYWLASGDMETLNKVWEPTAANLDEFFKLRDPDGNLLVNFHKGCNAFLYQADHLGLPGDAFSPSVMMSDCLDKMAEMADARGECEKASKWRHQADYMRSEIIRRLWSPADGKFVAAINTQGSQMQANYYTDFVFPELYSKLPAEYSWISLKTLDKTLWSGDHLMQAGNFKPPLFANDTVMPTQMAEAAEAYCKVGRSKEGYKLLYGTALAATIFTDSPGSFPERMSYTGFGQPDYAFGNPTGSFLRAVVSGLFGLERVSADKALIWRPSVPEDWESSSLKVGDIKMSTSGVHGMRKYSIILPNPQSLDFQIPLHGHIVEKVINADGRAVKFTTAAHPNGNMLQIRLAPATDHEFIVFSKLPSAPSKIPSKVKPGQKVEWILPSEGMSVHDPQGVFEQFRIDGATLQGRLSKATGELTFFICNEQSNSMAPIELNFGVPAKPKCKPLVLQGQREHLSLMGKFNSDNIPSKNWWCSDPMVLDLSPYTAKEGGKSFLTAGDYKFEVLPTGQNMILLTIGQLDNDKFRLTLFDKPNAITFNIGKPVSGFEFLVASEWEIRNTMAEVGYIKLHYADGSSQTEPLVNGRNIGSVYDPLTTEAVDVDLMKWPGRHLCAFALQADPTRKLDSLEIRLITTDGSIGIFAINAILPK